MAKRFAVAAIVVVLVLVIPAYVFWTRTPQYALREAAEAVKTHDLARFQRYVDTERLTTRFVDDMLATATEEASKETLGGLAAGMMMMMRPQMLKAGQDALERAVETGRFEDTSGESAGPADAAKPYWKRTSGEESGFRRIAYVKKQGKIAVAGLEIYDADLKMPFTIELKLRDLGSHWQIIEISNIPAFQKAVREGTEKRLNELNAPIRAQLAQTIEVEHVMGWAQADRWGIDRKAAVRLRLRNSTSRPIAEVQFSISFMVRDSFVGRINCVQDRIAPGQYEDGTWSKDINQFDQKDMMLFEAIDNAQAIAEIRSVKFEDGTSIALLTEVGPTKGARVSG